MKKERKPIPAYRYIATRVFVFGLAIWLLFAGVFTWLLSEAFVYQVKNKAFSYASQLFLLASDSPDAGADELVISMDRRMDELMSKDWVYEKILPIMLPHSKSDIFNPGPKVKLAISDHDKNDIPRRHLDFEDKITVCEEVAFAFQQGDTVVDSRSHMSYAYTSLENWQSGNPQPTGYGLTYLDVPYSSNHHYWFPSTKGYGQFRDNCLLRLTGYLEGNIFYPVSIEYGAYVYHNIADLCSMDAKNELSWKTVADYDIPSGGRELQTIYAWDINTSNYMYESFSINADTYSDLVDYIYKNDKSRQGNILETIIEERFHVSGYHEVYTIAIRCWPLRYVLIHGCHIYLISFLLTGMIMILVLWQIRKRLTTPLNYLVMNRKLHPFENRSGVFSELHTINSRLQGADQKLTEAGKTLAEANAEIQRLNKALDYAKDAEENRRKLVSNITHELKTPLAIIHSYAEGLQEGIAVEKQDRYLSVITEETERMDAMVLEMLDLSRLEAGKVRLAADRISLLTVARTVTDKFAPMLEARDLTLTFDQEETHIITADESRITQAITNLVSNAFKYAPKGSTICVRVGLYSESGSFYLRSPRSPDMLSFSIENESEPLSEETLQKVWDSFYRTDPSRTEPGTGLGLAIVKSIVDLHQGECFARNTARSSGSSSPKTRTGVEFGFAIPLR